MTPPDDFREFLQRLNARDVRSGRDGLHDVDNDQIDIMTFIKGVDLQAAWDRRVAGILDGVHVSFISKDDLVANKRAVARPEDLADIARLGGS